MGWVGLKKKARAGERFPAQSAGMGGGRSYTPRSQLVLCLPCPQMTAGGEPRMGPKPLVKAFGAA